MAETTAVAKARPTARAEQRQAAILQAAVQLFTEEGFHASTTRKIAARAAVSEGTLFNYFGSKNELLLAILDDFYEDLEASAREGIGKIMDTRERLQFLAENHVRALVANNALMIRLIQVYLGVDLSYYVDYRKTHLHELNYRYTRVFDGVVREGIQRGYLDPELNLPALRDLFFGGLEYGMRTVLGRSEGRDFRGHVHAIVEPLWQSMQATAAVQPTGAEALQSRLEKTCERLERAARRLEGR
jgi:AcrR family transcriptional regulator